MELNMECGISKNIEKNLRHYISHAKMHKARLNHQNKLAPSLSADEILSKRKELINETRKCSRQKLLDINRAIQTPKKQTKQERTLEKANKIKQKLLDWKIEKEKKKEKSLNKLKPFVTGTVKTPLDYVPPPPLPSKLKTAKENYSKILGGAKPPQPFTFKAGPSHQSKNERKDNKEDIQNGVKKNRKKGICDELPLTWAPSKPGTSYEYAEPAVPSCSGITPNGSVVMKVEDVTNSMPTKESATTKSANKDSKEKKKPVARSCKREMVLEAKMAMKSKKVSPNIKMENIEILEAGFSKKLRTKSEAQSSCDSDPNSPTTPLL